MDWRIETYEEVSSTQDILKSKTTEPEGLVVTAQTQSHGRGRQGREWISGEGNLFASVLLKPEMPVHRVGELSLLTGLALGKALKPYLKNPEIFMLKWPNDVLIAQKKVAGLLIETSLMGQEVDAVYLGFGVNIVSAPPEVGIALNDVSNNPLTSRKMLETILQNLARLYEDWQNGAFGAIKQQWLDLAHPFGHPLSVHVQGQKLYGTFEGLDQEGHLRLKTADGIETITAGDVEI